MSSVRRGFLNNRLSNRRLCLAASRAANCGALNQYNCIVLYCIRSFSLGIRSDLTWLLQCSPGRAADINTCTIAAGDARCCPSSYLETTWRLPVKIINWIQTLVCSFFWPSMNENYLHQRPHQNDGLSAWKRSASNNDLVIQRTKLNLSEHVFSIAVRPTCIWNQLPKEIEAATHN